MLVEGVVTRITAQNCHFQQQIQAESDCLEFPTYLVFFHFFNHFEKLLHNNTETCSSLSQLKIYILINELDELSE